ncbi:MAG: sulfotransferase family 2 domain-containing protein, partial [Desulfobacteraceae bacterium]|nr:sulfotransferase family 2 domain-containing protein [Desulfobacteraceae bacterium]
MAILLKNGAIFLHIPKTGGNWIAKVLEQARVSHLCFGHKHLDLDEVMRFERYLVAANRWNEPSYQLFRFCFVRHPVHWYESWWRMMQKLGWPDWGTDGSIDDWHPNAVLNGLGHQNFNHFVEKVLRKRPGYVTELYGRYTNSGINFIGRQENLIEDLLKALRECSVTVDEVLIRSIHRVNVSDRAIKVDWDPDLLAEVSKVEYASIRRYGYRKISH